MHPSAARMHCYRDEFLLMHIGLIAGGFKPFTAGHFFLVEEAARENDLVYLFVSTKDRVRSGQHPITWKQMKPVWKILQSILPSNVEVHFSDNPTTSQFDILVDAEKDPTNHNIYYFYADSKDIKRYDNPRIRERTLPRLYSSDQLIFKSFSRSSGVDVSGTMVRKALADGNLADFTKMMPSPAQQYAPKIFKLLGGRKAQ